MQQRTKFSLAPEMDFRSKIQEIFDRVPCKRHDAQIGEPCWWIPSDSQGMYAGICQHRISHIYNGQIDPQSTENRRPKKEFKR